MNKNQQKQQQQDSVYYYKPSQFKDFIQRISDKYKLLLVSDVLQGFREISSLASKFKQITIEELSRNPELIEGVYYGLRNNMQPPSKFQLPYNCSKVERQREILEQIVDYCQDKDDAINQDKAVCKIITGQYSGDGVRVFGYAIEVAAAPYKNYTLQDGGRVDLIGCINSTPSIDGGESYFQGGHYEWIDNTKDEMLMTASSVREILSRCGFSNYYWREQNKSKRRVPCIFYINLICPVLDWLGSAGKTHIDLQPFASEIAKAVSSIAYKMPTFRGYDDGTKILEDSSSSYYKPYVYTAKDYLIDFLKQRKKAVEQNPSLKVTDRITQSTVWYRIRPIMVENNFQPRKTWGITRETLQNEINEICRELWPDEDILREDLGIIASARATMYYSGMSYPVSIDNVKNLAENGVVVIVIEKEGIADVLTTFADKYGVALVHTKGHFVEYCKDLIEAVEESGGNVATLTDYDAVGIKIANGARIDIPRIGIDRDTIIYFQEHGFPDLTEEQVEEGYTPKISTDFIVEDEAECKYLKTKRIELDSLLAAVGNAAFWNYIMYRLKELFPEGMDYNRVMSSSPGSLSDYLPPVIRKLTGFIESRVHPHIVSLFREEKKQIESELENVKGFIDIAVKRQEIHERYQNIAESDPGLEKIGAKLDDVFKKVMEELETKLKENDRDDGGDNGHT